jgi:hypothetical protein
MNGPHPLNDTCAGMVQKEWVNVVTAFATNPKATLLLFTETALKFLLQVNGNRDLFTF